MLLSIIVPVYNAGPYLKPCVESLCALPYEKEIILVDDGSTDGAVYEGFARRLCEHEDPAETKAAHESLAGTKATHEGVIKVIRQENQGVSAARNRGLLEAKGEWIWFVDADDVVHENHVRKYFGHESSASTKAVHEGENLLLLPFEWEEDGEIENYEPHDGEIPYNLWRCWFRREEIERQGLRFTPGRKYAEDQEFILRFLLQQSDKSIVAPDGAVVTSLGTVGGKAWADGPIYHYVMRSGGAMKKPGTKQKQLRDICRVWWRVFFLSVRKGQIGKKWVLKELKRLAKTWYVTARR